MNRSWHKSRLLLQRSAQSLTGGVSSPFRAKAAVPLFFQDGRGSRLQDVDGNWYIDYTLAWGPNILGYRHPKVVEAVRRAAEGPHTYGAQHVLEFQVSERIQQLAPCAQRVAFTSSGSEACQLAWRLARAFTGRNLILKFEGHYHGWMDSVLVSYHPRGEMGPPDAPRAVLHSRGQVPNTGDNLLVATWNSIDAVERAFAARGSEIAAVVMEPVLCNSGCILPLPGYLAQVREICASHGALLIFDEVITGFRIALGGAHGHYGVAVDLATFGKALGGGLPLSAVAGRKEIFEMIISGGVAFGGSFNGNPVSLAGAHATLDELARDGGAALAHAHRIGALLMEGIRAAAARHSVPLLVAGFPTGFALHFTSRSELRDYRGTLDDDHSLLARFARQLLAEGIYILPDGRMYVSTAHNDTDVEETLSAFDRAFRDMDSGHDRRDDRPLPDSR